MYNFDANQFKFARTLKEAELFGGRGYSHKYRNYNLLKKLLSVPQFKKLECVFSRESCQGFLTVKYDSATIGLDTDIVIDSFKAERYSVMLRNIGVPPKDRQKGFFKNIVALISNLFQDDELAIVTCVKPYSMTLDPSWNKEKEEALKDKMEDILYDNGWKRISFMATAFYGGDTIERNSGPEPHRLFVLLNKSPDYVQSWYQSMMFYEDE